MSSLGKYIFFALMKLLLGNKISPLSIEEHGNLSQHASVFSSVLEDCMPFLQHCYKKSASLQTFSLVTSIKIHAIPLVLFFFFLCDARPYLDFAGLDVRGCDLQALGPALWRFPDVHVV